MTKLTFFNMLVFSSPNFSLADDQSHISQKKIKLLRQFLNPKGTKPT